MLRTLDACKVAHFYYVPAQHDGICDGVIINGVLLKKCAECYLHDINNARRICIECGKEFYSISPKAKMCSKECKRARQFKLKQSRVTQKPKKTLDELLAEINEYNRTHGTHLTYGKYQEMKFRERRTADNDQTN